MRKKILIAAAVVIGLFLVYVAMQPSSCNISREMVINATPETLFPLINNSKKANDWMPWKESDPGVKIEFSGPEEGLGAKSSWNSEGSMGVGEAVVIESIPNKSVKTQLTYTQPMNMSQVAEVALTPVEGGTKVRWSVDGHNGFIFKLFGFFVNVDKMVGGEFEKGLTKLKNTAESSK